MKGKLVTSKQYAKQAIPESIIKTMKLSMSLSRDGVSFLYACQDCVTTREADCVTLAGDTLDAIGVAPAGLRGILLGAICAGLVVCLSLK